MPFMGTLDSGKSATISFAADPTNAGTCIVLGTWLGGNNTPDVPILPIAPATNQSATVDVPACRLLQLNIHVPQAGHGSLTVTQGTTSIAKPVVADVTWILMVNAP